MDASASHALPPAGVTGDPTQYGVFGGRLTAELDWTTAALTVSRGAALAGGQGRWLQGSAAVATGARLGVVGLRAVVSGFGLRYLDPFSYDAGGVEIRPAASYPAGRFVLSLVPRLSLGHWTTGEVEGDLQVAGAEIDVQRLYGALGTRVSASMVHVENGVTAGTFAQAGAELSLDRSSWNLALQARAQSSPLETEVGGGVRLVLTAGPGVELQAYVGQRLRDPLFGTAGSFGASLGASLRPLRLSPPRTPSVAEVGEAQDGGHMVRFAIHAPDAEVVELTGDFTAWEPIDMDRGESGWWRASRVVGPGLHHFGFLVDGQWAIPPEAPGVVEDGWGRKNASIVVAP